MTTDIFATRRTFAAAITRQDCSESRPVETIAVPRSEWQQVLERLEMLERRVRDLRVEAV